MALIGNQREWILNGRLLVYTCSHEHEKAFVVSGAHISEGQWQTSTAGAGFMDPALQTLKAMLEAIGDAAVNALDLIGQSQEQRSMRWTCKACQ